MKKRLFAAFLCLTMICATLTGCVRDAGNNTASNSGTSAVEATSTASPASTAEPAAAAGGVLNSVEGFMYSSLDPHKDYYSWHSLRYGLTETLFRLTDDLKIEPWLAESLDIVDNVATLTLKDGVCFSNGNPLTADMVKRNMLRLAEMNNRFSYVNDFELEAINDKTLLITMPKALPTLKNELTNPEFCMVDLDATKRF